ncbi:hypothetical protein P3T51_11105 [Weissella confusa]|uniref:hypothetical protein n=1 Tax=Weissella confusa TaxID=1583 RepID=UPI002407E58F|nr:hypothetical protein [Weissella confusa]WEY48068.1 hypothetical protein P3T51_11105 [Weissella confusa]
MDKYGIHISNNYQLVGDERNVRVLLFEMLYTAYADQPSPFPDEVTALATNVEYLVEDHTPMRATVKRALRIFFGIWMTRIRHGHVIAASEPDVGADVKIMDSFFGAARCRYPEKFSKPGFQPKMA